MNEPANSRDELTTWDSPSNSSRDNEGLTCGNPVIANRVLSDLIRRLFQEQPPCLRQKGLLSSRVERANFGPADALAVEPDPIDRRQIVDDPQREVVAGPGARRIGVGEEGFERGERDRSAHPQRRIGGRLVGTQNRLHVIPQALRLSF